MTEKLKSLIANLKHHPGVYLMHDKDGVIIYVGKAKDLQKRVSQYFLRPQSGKVQKMAMSVDYFETILTKNEKEAFILEMNLIQEHMPRYNILLKDDSHYPYIALKKGKDPVIRIKRNTKEKGYEYFGPFPNSSAAYEMVNLVNKLFPIRKCKNIPSTPCLYYHLGQCLAPCINKIDESELAKLYDDISRFLNGDNQKIKIELEKKIKEASENLEFEIANDYNNLLKAINHINIKQTVEANSNVNADIFAYSSRDDYLSIAILLYRKGILLGKECHVVERFGDEEEQVAELILQYYEHHELPKEVVVNNENIVNELNEIFDNKVLMVSKGKFHDAIVTAKENANNGIDEYFMSARLDDNKLALLDELGHILNIKTPYHIELFDNSHIQGSFPVGAMVAFINGEPAKKLYRKFNINHEESRDDFASMKEVISRHYLRSKEENKKLPDLILVDGGLSQVHAAIDALNSIGVNILVFGLFKGIGSGHQTTGIIDKEGNEYPITNKALFFLLTRMQDEVHRFAISFHRNTRNKAMTKSILDDIPGLGYKRKEIIERTYPDINKLKEASIEELSQIVPKAVAISIHELFHKDS